MGYHSPTGMWLPEKKAPPPEAITSREIEAIRALQIDLPVVSEPFADAAAAHGFEVSGLLAQGQLVDALGA